jgi:hypothetical protein
VVGNNSSAVIGAVMFYKKLALADELLKPCCISKGITGKNEKRINSE